MPTTHTPSPEEMERRIARFDKLTPTAKRHQAEAGVPPELYEMLSAKRTYVFMAPEGLGGPISGGAGIMGGDGGAVFRVGIAICPPGNGPVLHAHMSTHETFINTQGDWEVRWGDEGEHRTRLGLYDTLAVPPGVCRQFVNVGSGDAHLLVIIQGERDKFDDVYNPPAVRDRIVERFGPEALPMLKAIGIRFLDESEPQRQAAE